MKSPKDMRIIQIDITNACTHKCSNCTRFCGHHKKPYFMDYETFKRAVDSLDGYVGIIGFMGGEPTLHPNFEQMIEYASKKKKEINTTDLIFPQKHFMDAIHNLECVHSFAYPCGNGDFRQTVDGIGLWSAIGESYKKHYEIIQDKFHMQSLNDHSNPMFHQPILISRKSLDIPDDKWHELRDKCWLQNLWSASITPKGAFFCEIAGTLDLLFNGPGGWNIEKGWWKREPSDFGEQLKWCELCGLALHTFTRPADDGIDDVSPDLYEKLKEINSKKIKFLNVVKPKAGVIPKECMPKENKRFSDILPFTENYDSRFNEISTNLTKKTIDYLFILHSEEQLPFLKDWLKKVNHIQIYCAKKLYLRIADKIIEKDTSDRRNLSDNNCKGRVIDWSFSDNETIGASIFNNIFNKDYCHFLMVIDGCISPTNVIERMNQLVLNPGTLMYRFWENDYCDNYFRALKNSQCLLINPTAKNIKRIGGDKLLGIRNISELKELWEPQKLIEFSPNSEKVLPTGKIKEKSRCFIFGAGRGGEATFKTLKKAKLTILGFIDSNEEKQAKSICGLKVYSPSFLENEENKMSFDYIIISVGLISFNAVRNKLNAMGISDDKLAWVDC